MLLRTSGRILSRVNTLQYASSSRNLLIEDTRVNVFLVGCPNICLLTCGSRRDYAIMRQTVESYSVVRRSWQPGHSTTMGGAPMEIDAVYGDKRQERKHAKGKRKHKGKHESSPQLEGCCGHCGKWRHKQKRPSKKEHCCRRGGGGGICRTSRQQCEQQHDTSHITTSLVVLQLELRRPRRDLYHKTMKKYEYFEGIGNFSNPTAEIRDSNMVL